MSLDDELEQQAQARKAADDAAERARLGTEHAIASALTILGDEALRVLKSHAIPSEPARTISWTARQSNGLAGLGPPVAQSMALPSGWVLVGDRPPDLMLDPEGTLLTRWWNPSGGAVRRMAPLRAATSFFATVEEGPWRQLFEQVSWQSGELLVWDSHKEISVTLRSILVENLHRIIGR